MVVSELKMVFVWGYNESENAEVVHTIQFCEIRNSKLSHSSSQPRIFFEGEKGYCACHLFPFLFFSKALPTLVNFYDACLTN